MNPNLTRILSQLIIKCPIPNVGKGLIKNPQHKKVSNKSKLKMVKPIVNKTYISSKPKKSQANVQFRNKSNL